MIILAGERGGDLFEGYLDDPAVTDRSFHVDDDGVTWFLTGDLAARGDGGAMRFVGRVDDVIKVAGENVSLTEVEAILAQAPGVFEVAVLPKADEVRDQVPVAYVVPRREPGPINIKGSEAAPTTSELRHFLATKLPDYMVPTVFVPLQALPLTPNGKVNRRALPAPDRSRQALGIEYVAPRTPIEETLAAIWAQILHLERVGAHDNFFELGGHSLLATQLVSRLRNVFQVDLPLRALFESPTVAGLAENIGAARQMAQGL